MATNTTTTSLARIQTDPNASANPTATAYFQTTTVINGVTYQAPWSSVTWPLLETGKAVTLSDGTRLTYAQISEGVTTIAYTELALVSGVA